MATGLGLSAAVAVAGMAAAAPASTAATTSGTHRLTIAARVCPEYTDVTANRARNNLQQSLRDLGADTTYGTGGVLVDLTKEESDQSACQPLPDAVFTFGKNTSTTVVAPNLSTVAQPGPALTTFAGTPLLSTTGAPTGKLLKGAVTRDLTTAEVASAAQKQLWVMGGTPSKGTPDGMAFASLRCATDNLNGDNVEFVQFPTGVTHVFCFAYYIQPAPKSGSITIHQAIQGNSTGAPSFSYTGNLSFNAGGALTLSDGGTGYFTRAVSSTDKPWTIQQGPRDGWGLTSVACIAGNSSWTADASNLKIALAAGDNVNCTFTNARQPVAGPTATDSATPSPSATETPGSSATPTTSPTETGDPEPVETNPAPVETTPAVIETTPAPVATTDVPIMTTPTPDQTADTLVVATADPSETPASCDPDAAAPQETPSANQATPTPEPSSTTQADPGPTTSDPAPEVSVLGTKIPGPPDAPLNTVTSTLPHTGAGVGALLLAGLLMLTLGGAIVAMPSGRRSR